MRLPIRTSVGVAFLGLCALRAFGMARHLPLLTGYLRLTAVTNANWHWEPKPQQQINKLVLRANGPLSGLAPVHLNGAIQRGSITHGDRQKVLSYLVSVLHRRRRDWKNGQRSTIVGQARSTVIISRNAGAACP